MSADQKRATLEEMNELHAELARACKKALRHQYTDDEGNPVPPPASTITAVTNFLKNNGITGAAITPKKVTDFLDEASLPFFEEALRDVAQNLQSPEKSL